MTMCIIAAKPAGIKMPDLETIETMWRSNPDGAGLMYVGKQVKTGGGKKRTTNVVKIEKGFMKLSDFTARLQELETELDLTATPVVMHFRITTHGGTCPENCHPFPITGSVGVLKKRKAATRVGVAHNGIIHITPRKGISDTMEYILTQLAPLQEALPRFYENKHAMRLVENAIGSKMAFLTSEGNIYTIGKFETCDGIKYSNDSYLPWTMSARYGFGCYDGWFDSCFADYKSGKKGKGKRKEPKPVYQDLMYLEDVEGAYGVMPDGDFVEGVDLALNPDNVTYRYDGDLNAWVEARGVGAFTAEGTHLRFDPELAYASEETYLEDDAMQLYELLFGDDDETDTPDRK